MVYLIFNWNPEEGNRVEEKEEFSLCILIVAVLNLWSDNPNIPAISSLVLTLALSL